VRRGRSLWVGTYKGGVTRFDWDAGGGAGDVRAWSLGDGWINPGGLRWIDGALVASTMEGLRVGDGATAAWRTIAGLPGRDVTGAIVFDGAWWIATRRGLIARVAP